jgi:hypothetical protein
MVCTTVCRLVHAALTTGQDSIKMGRYTFVPATTNYFFIEIGSGGFENANYTGAWLNPGFTYALSVSRGTVVTP